MARFRGTSVILAFLASLPPYGLTASFGTWPLFHKWSCGLGRGGGSGGGHPKPEWPMAGGQKVPAVPGRVFLGTLAVVPSTHLFKNIFY